MSPTQGAEIARVSARARARTPARSTLQAWREPLGLVFGATALLLAAHAAIDSWLAPEAGSGASEHLLRLTATVAILAAAVVLYARLPAGGRAALSAAVGLLALVGAFLAIADARAVGARDEDWSGFLLLPVGIILLGLSGRQLWCSRKQAGRRHLRRAGIALAALLGAYWLLVPVGIAIIATHRPRADVAPADLGRPYDQVTLKTKDGLSLAAWYVPSRNGAAVVLYPSRQGAAEHARMLARHGYGVLIVDARGYDGSQGDPNLFGWEGATDVDAAVAWLGRRPEVVDGRIGGMGFSVGGEVMLEAAASNDALRAVVSEGAGVRSVREHLLRGPKGWFSLPEAAVQTAAVAVMSGSAPPPSLGDIVSRIAPRPLLLIYAGRGGGGEELTPDYYRAASQPKSLWRIDEARHVGGYEARPREYEARVVELFDQALLGKAG
jgi:uncharacterized protein